MSHTISLSVSLPEFKLIEEIAQREGLTKGGFAKKVVLDNCRPHADRGPTMGGKIS